MKRALTRLALSAALLCAILSPAALAQRHSREHRAAVKICKQQYRNKVRALHRLKGHDRRLRVAEAKRELRECIEKAPQ